MLDERREYAAYLSGDLRRIPLRSRMFSENLAGIRRPLQVLARGFLEKAGESELPPEQAVAACKGLLFAIKETASRATSK